MAKQHAQLAARQAVELCERLARKRRHNDRVLHEDRGHRGKGATKVAPLAAPQGEYGRDEACAFAIRKRKRNPARSAFPPRRRSPRR